MVKVNPDGVMSNSYLSDKFPTVLTNISPKIKQLSTAIIYNSHFPEYFSTLYYI